MKELEEIKAAYQNLRTKRFNLWSFEFYIRKVAYSKMIGQSNSQKMQLEFENIAENGENRGMYEKLQKELVDAEVKYHQAEWDYEVAMKEAKGE